MKPLFTLLFTSVLGSSLLFAGETKVYPDFSKVFSTEKLFDHKEAEGVESYFYATNSEFEELQKKLRKFLGAGWIEAEADPEVRKTVNETTKKGGVTLKGYTSFSNPAFPGASVILGQTNQTVDGKKFLAQLIVGQLKAEQDGADQPATAPESKQEGNSEPQPESEERPQ